MRISLLGEDGLDWELEKSGEFEGEGKARVEAAGLDGVDGLSRDAELGGEIGLAPISLGSECAEGVVHR